MKNHVSIISKSLVFSLSLLLVLSMIAVVIPFVIVVVLDIAAIYFLVTEIIWYINIMIEMLMVLND